MQLYSYFRSSAAWRVRIALALKGVTVAQVPVHLTRNGGEQKRPEFRAKNPLGVVPVLETDDGTLLTQSLAIIEWLEDTYPMPRLLPVDPLARARVRAFALTVACEIHPLNNLRALHFLEHDLGQDQSARDAWYHHWISEGLTALEAMLVDRPFGPFCFGTEPGLAECCLVPQMANARRFKCPVDAYPRLCRAETAALALPAFRETAPDRQADAE